MTRLSVLIAAGLLGPLLVVICTTPADDFEYVCLSGTLCNAEEYDPADCEPPETVKAECQDNRRYYALRSDLPQPDSGGPLDVVEFQEDWVEFGRGTRDIADLQVRHWRCGEVIAFTGQEFVRDWFRPVTEDESCTGLSEEPTPDRREQFDNLWDQTPRSVVRSGLIRSLRFLASFESRERCSEGGRSSVCLLKRYLESLVGPHGEVELIWHTGIRQPSLHIKLPGKLPEKGGVLIGAHIDSYKNSPGVDDNASGVAVLVATLEVLADADELPTFERDIHLGFFANEEYGRDGSIAIFRKLCGVVEGFPTDCEKKIKGVLNFDMVGSGVINDDLFLAATGSGASLNPYLLELHKKYGLNEYFALTESGSNPSSDHITWAKTCVPTSGIMEGETLTNCKHTGFDTVADVGQLENATRLAVAFLFDRAILFVQ